MERGINLLNTEENSGIVLGRNPVMEALKNDREIEKILIAKGTEGSILKIVGMAKDKKIPVMYGDKVALDRVANGVPHQGVIAYTSSFKYCEVEEILALAKAREEDPFIIILDNIEDPHNLGAIMRSAEVTGAHGLIIPKRRAVGVTDVVTRASAGAVEYMACAKVANIVQTIEKLKAAGLWIGACDVEGQPYYKANLKGGICLVIGSEGFGISKLVKEKCDFTVSIPMVGKIGSLNASNAAVVLMCEVRRQRDVE
ncbi:MAG: 23S rRNA (guanosine(2251)-2'-O)-methyltransferase RlmB [Peptostreptococcaceae bacterium]|nr:23S rRNA (guanosine(2251)-2'-O)-methyltransferase RlmB [Peptostreptococcaceae bacterium]